MIYQVVDTYDSLTVGKTYEDLVRMDRSEIKLKVRNYDNKVWQDNLFLLTNREIYRRFKRSVGRSFGYDNRLESELLFRARSNTLDLNDFNRHGGGDIRCELCGADREDISHFILFCPTLERYRDKKLIDKIGGLGSNVDRVGNLLFNKANIGSVKNLLGTLWKERAISIIKIDKDKRAQNKKGKLMRKPKVIDIKQYKKRRWIKRGG